VAVDVGGTFTDAVLVLPTGEVLTAKVLTTVDDQSLGVVEAVEAVLRGSGCRAEALARFVHGTTAATNALLERTGGRTALLATEGFGDVLFLRRQARASLYDLTTGHAEPLVAARDVVEVAERNTAQGTVLALSDEAVEAAVSEVAQIEPDAVAICLLFSFAHPEHERALAGAVKRRCPDVDVIASSDLIPEFREYERATTTVADAYLARPTERYIRRLLDRSAESELPSPLVMKSNGGMAEAASGHVHPVHLVLSGPAGGLIGARQIAQHVGITSAVTLDMGGTSTDVGLIADGELRRSNEVTVGGLPLRVPSFDLSTVGAGGSSIAWIDDGGALRVGPRSAGSSPGPACYSRGGGEPTVTDAHVVLRRIDSFGGLGGLVLDSEASRESLESVSQGFESVEHAAAGIIRVADVEIAQAVKTMTVDRGLDPHDFHIVAFGGAGPLHAVAVAAELRMAGIVVPVWSGVLSALGLALSDLRFDFSRTILTPVGALALERLDEIAAELLLDCPFEPTNIERQCDMRYRGQSFELPIPFLPDDDDETLRERFEAVHAQLYGFRSGGAAVEVVTVRIGAIEQVATVRLDGRQTGPRPARAATRVVWCDGEPLTASIHEIDPSEVCLRVPIDGPAVVRLPTATCLIPPDWRATQPTPAALLIERA
jgi:N-methylhydantoinase A